MTVSYTALVRSVAAHWRLKLTLSVVLTLFFSVPYFTIQHVSIVPARQLPLGALDRVVPFMPAWVWVYQSVYLLLSTVPWLARRAGDLRRYATGFVIQASIGFACFLAIPVIGPRPGVVPVDGMFALLVSYDSPLNSFPSLHVALATYTVFFAGRISRGRLSSPVRKVVLTALAGWVAVIAFATIATKQHYVVDVPAGILLAWFCDWAAWSRALRRSTLVRARISEFGAF